MSSDAQSAPLEDNFYGVERIQTLSTMPNEDQAKSILKKLAAILGPILLRRKWTISILECYSFLVSNLDDVNTSCENSVKLRLRLPPPKQASFLDMDHIVGVILHALTDREHSYPSAEYFELLAKLREEVKIEMMLLESPTCVVCLGERSDDESERLYHCTCGIHYIHIGACFDQWIHTEWGLTVPALSNTSTWGNIRGCPVCRAAPAVVAEDLLPYVSLLSHSVLGTATKAVLLSQVSRNSDSTVVGTSSSGNRVVRDRVCSLVAELQELSVLKCPSCKVAFSSNDPARGCDAVWCENEACRRAFCLLCLQDCGDHMKTDSTADNPLLIGDAHQHVLHNDCGLTIPGLLFSSNEVIADVHRRRVQRLWFQKLVRMDPTIVEQVCKELGVKESIDEMKQCLKVAGQHLHHGVSNESIVKNAWYLPFQRNLLTSSFNGDIDIVKKMLALGVDVNVKDENMLGSTSLMFSARRGHPLVVKLLLEHGAKALTTDTAGRNALHLVGDGTGSLEVARLLLQAAYRERNTYQEKKQEGGKGGTYNFTYPWALPMHGGATVMQVSRKHALITSYYQQLEQLGIAFTYACSIGDVSAVRSLLAPDRLTRLDVCTSDVANAVVEDVLCFQDRGVDGNDGLMFAANQGHAPMVGVLLEVGMKVMRQDMNGWNALHYAARGGNFETVRRCVVGAYTERISSVPTDTTGIWSPWTISTRNGQQCTALVLASRFPDIVCYWQQLNWLGGALLHACSIGDANAVMNLLCAEDMEAGGNINMQVAQAVVEDAVCVRDATTNRTPLTVAIELHPEDVALQLIAQLQTSHKFSQTVLWANAGGCNTAVALAEKKKYYRIMSVLLNNESGVRSN